MTCKATISAGLSQGTEIDSKTPTTPTCETTRPLYLAFPPRASKELQVISGNSYAFREWSREASACQRDQEETGRKTTPSWEPIPCQGRR